MGKLKFEELTYKIRGAFFEVYNILGPGFKESIYAKALSEEFRKLGLSFKINKKIDIFYKNKKVGIYEPDFIIEDKIIVELKAAPVELFLFEKQLYSYLKVSKYKVGFLVNFGTDKLEIKRRIYG